MPVAPPTIRPRHERLRAYLVYNRTRMLVDTAVLLAWVLGTWWFVAVLGLPRWFTYVIVFAGVLTYTRITPTWERPYHSPDLDDDSVDSGSDNAHSQKLQ